MTDYPRTLEEDKIVLSHFYKKDKGWSVQPMFGASLALSPVITKRAFLKFGALSVAFIVHDSFWGYRSGVYKHREGEGEGGGHAVTAIGYGPDYIMTVNSWHHWGDAGRCKMWPGELLWVFIPHNPLKKPTAQNMPSSFPIPGGPRQPPDRRAPTRRRLNHNDKMPPYDEE